MSDASLWLMPRDAQAYVGSKSIKGWYAWRDRHHIIARSNGSVAKRDLDRELRKKKAATRRGFHVNSRANLAKRHSSAQAGKQGLSV